MVTKSGDYQLTFWESQVDKRESPLLLQGSFFPFFISQMVLTLYFLHLLKSQWVFLSPIEMVEYQVKDF